MARDEVMIVKSACSISGFKPGDDWEIFSKEIEQCFLGNLVVLITVIDEEVYEVLKNFGDPVPPNVKNVVENTNTVDSNLVRSETRKNSIKEKNPIFGGPLWITISKMK